MLLMLLAEGVQFDIQKMLVQLQGYCVLLVIEVIWRNNERDNFCINTITFNDFNTCNNL